MRAVSSRLLAAYAPHTLHCISAMRCGVPFLKATGVPSTLNAQSPVSGLTVSPPTVKVVVLEGLLQILCVLFLKRT